MKKTVLIADDSASTRQSLKALFLKSGYAVVGEAADGLEALDLYVRYKPQLVTLDLVMPTLDGLAAAQEIIQYDPQAKVIMISSSLTQKIIQQAEELGVRSFVIKPITLEKLSMALELLKSPKKDVKYG